MEYNQSKKISAIVSIYKGEKYLQGFLDNVATQTVFDQLDLVVVHNEPTANEVSVIQKFQAKYQGVLNHIVVARESLAVSTNRAIRAAKGEYVCIWNVDDLRTQNSLEMMAKTLDEDPAAGFTYGDFSIVKRWLGKEGRKVSCPEFSKKEFVQSMFTGPFYMWRKILCEKIGYWDEQCRQGADFDFSSRLAVESTGKKTNGLLGYYLDEGLGMSTNRATLQPIERVFIELRFGVYHKLDFWYYNRAKKYRINEILYNGKWIKKEELMPHWQECAESKWWIAYALIRYPFWLAKRVIRYIAK